jgi:hypothetical protein
MKCNKGAHGSQIRYFASKHVLRISDRLPKEIFGIPPRSFDSRSRFQGILADHRPSANQSGGEDDFGARLGVDPDADVTEDVITFY